LQAFAALYAALDASTSTNAKVAALTDYFRSAQPADAAWAVFFLTGEKLPQAVPVKRLRELTIRLSGLPEWLFAESYDAVGDLAETIALLLPPARAPSQATLARWVAERLLPLRTLPEDEQTALLTRLWDELDGTARFVGLKLITGAFRVGVSKLLVIRALAAVSGVDGKVIAHRLMGSWQPTAEAFLALTAAEASSTEASRPYPFFLAHPLEAPPESLGPRADWQAEWKWDGIRAQLIRRRGASFLWSRGDELVTDQFPEIVEAAGALPDGTVIDGEVLAWREGRVQPFAQLQRRLNRKQVSARLRADAPVALIAYDLLEQAGEDLRPLPLGERRTRLECIIGNLPQAARIELSPLVETDAWPSLAQMRDTSRERGVEGLMLKRRAAAYGVGRTRGDWWKWKIDPYTLDAVLIYAQRGHGKRASLYTDYTFGLWKDGELVPFAKAYSGLTDEEIAEVDAFIRKNTLEKFGPVRTVKPELVFELAFEGIQRSTRHKSGIAVRFPRMARWRRDKRIEEADTIEVAEGLLRE